ncbi:MAG: hypothetical protein ACK4UN_00880 [Limisphaerales bacterium]
MVTVLNRIFEINFQDDTWMIQLGKMSKNAECIILRNFAPNAASLPFIKAISSQNQLYISSWEDDLVLRRQ